MKNLFFVSVLLVVVHSEEQLKSEKLQINKPLQRGELQSRPFTVNLDHFNNTKSRHIQFVSNKVKLFYMFINSRCFHPTDIRSKFGTLYTKWTIVHFHQRQ